MAEDTPKTLDLAKLIANSAKGDESSYRSIFDHLNGRIFRYILSRSSHREDALDITQSVFIDLWRALTKFSYTSDEEFYGFVFLIAKRKLGKYYRSKKIQVELDDRFISDNFEMEVEDYRFLLKHLRILSTDQQEILRLRYWSGLSFKEIGAAMHMREGTAKVVHHRAIKKLEAHMRDNEK